MNQPIIIRRELEHILTFLSICSCLILSAACSPTVEEPDIAEENAKIMALHHAQRDHHFKGDAAAFVAQFSPSYRSVNRGEVKQPSAKESIAQFQPYFDAVEFISWDDTHPPLIEFSNDLSMAYTIVEKEVIVGYPLEDGSTFVDTTHFAWTTIYRKFDGEWKVDVVTSTTVPN